MRITEPGRNYACSVCGYQHVGPEPPKKCPLCGMDEIRYICGKLNYEEYEEGEFYDTEGCSSGVS